MWQNNWRNDYLQEVADSNLSRRESQPNGETAKFPRLVFLQKHAPKATLIALLACLFILSIFRVTSSIAGEYHLGQTLVCYDCHTMHFSQSHKWGAATPISSAGASGGDWLGSFRPQWIPTQRFQP